MTIYRAIATARDANHELFNFTSFVEANNLEEAEKKAHQQFHKIYPDLSAPWVHTIQTMGEPRPARKALKGEHVFRAIVLVPMKRIQAGYGDIHALTFEEAEQEAISLAHADFGEEHDCIVISLSRDASLWS